MVRPISLVTDTGPGTGFEFLASKHFQGHADLAYNAPYTLDVHFTSVAAYDLVMLVYNVRFVPIDECCI